MSFEEQKSLFDVEMDYEEIIETPEGYEQIRLSELDNHEIFVGKPQMSGLLTSEYDDGFTDDGKPKTRTVHKLRLVITNDEEKQFLDININLKKASLKVDKVLKGSVLFDFIQSILELENAGSTAKKNVFKNINLQQFIDFINGLEILGVKNIERTGTWAFNSFYVVQINNLK